MYLFTRASLWERGGYYTQKMLKKPKPNWTHLTFVYRVYTSPVLSRRLSSFVLYVDGEIKLSAFRKKPRDSEPADGRIVLGRTFSEVNDYYTSMEVDELLFYNHDSDPDEIKAWYESGELYPE